MLRGLRLAARQLARNPSFSAVVVLALALGIGASTLIYSVLDGVLLKPLPYPDADRIVRVFQVNADGVDRVSLSHPNFEDLKAQTRSFSALAVFETLTEPVVGGSEPARLEIVGVVADGDPVTIGSAVATLLAVVLAAAYVPARRASNVAPLEALRYD